MKTLIFTVVLTTGLWVVWQTAAGKAAAQDHSGELRASTVSPNEPLVFSPRAFDGMPAGQSRLITNPRQAAEAGASANLSRPFLLVPRQAAVTTQPHPSLFWYLPKPIDREIRLTINTPAHPDPIIELSFDGNRIQGIQRVDLEKLSITLHPGVVYEWVVKIVIDPQAPSKDVYAKSAICVRKFPKTYRRDGQAPHFDSVLSLQQQTGSGSTHWPGLAT